MKRIELLKKQLKPGKVYRRADLEQWSASVDRHLQQLVAEGILEKLSGGIYHVPEKNVFGAAPADEKSLVRSFLKDNDFVIISPNDYNTLGLGTTQLYNVRKVYNHKRHGTFKLGNRQFRFIRKPYVPKQLTEEFLLVDLVNNLKELEEDQTSLLSNIFEKIKRLNPARLKKAVRESGTVATKKILEPLIT